MLFRRVLSRPLLKTSLSAGVSAAVTQQRFQSKETLPVEKVWALWNDGNLFSLNIGQLHAFLTSMNVPYDASAKKALLIRLVEEVLQKRDDQQKGGQQGQQGGQYGNWNKGGGGGPETLLDLESAGFYENSASMAPKAFQLLVGGHTADLVVSRVNTTSFPGFPSNNECYTLTAAISDLAVRARYSKALQWCVLNMRNLNLQGEFAVDFGKMVLKQEIVKNNRRLVSAFTLQQRAQIDDPFIWVSTTDEAAIPAVETFLQQEGFAPVKDAHSQYFDTHIRRKRDVVNIELTPQGSLINGAEVWYPLQRSHIVSQTGGQDIRLQLRTRNMMRPNELARVKTISILKIDSDSVTSALPPELGQVIYTSENVIRTWSKVGEKNIRYTIRETRRIPLIVTKAEEEDDRLEYFITTQVPSPDTDLNWFANQLFDMAKRFQEVLTPHFTARFGTEVKPLAFETE